MNEKLKKLMEDRKAAFDRMNAILAEADKREDKKMTAEEVTEYDGLEARYDELGKESERLKKQIEREKEIRAAGTFPDNARVTVEDPPEFSKDNRGIGEFFYAIMRMKRDQVRDVRLERLFEKREQTMGTGATGGYALPEQFDATIRQVLAQDGIVRPRASVIPAGSPPDAKLTFPALDQTSGKNMYGGVTVVHTGEGVTMTETTAYLREVSLEPKEISAYIVVTDKLLNNWEAAGAFVSRQMSAAMVGQEDYDFLRGDGVNKSLGIINSAAAIAYTRAGAGAIAFADVYGMYARTLMGRGGSYVWLASQTIIPQLAAMTDAGTHAVWLGGGDANGAASQSMPNSLFGFPIIFCDRLPALGTKGDLNLVNLSYYLIKEGSGPMAASSEHVYFTSNKVVFKVVWNVDARPWLTEPIALEGSTTNTVSPFVILQ